MKKDIERRGAIKEKILLTHGHFTAKGCPYMGKISIARFPNIRILCIGLYLSDSSPQIMKRKSGSKPYAT